MTPNQSQEPTKLFGLEQLIQSATSIKFPTGIFGKTCMLLAVFAISAAAMSWSVSEPWVTVITVLVVAAVVTYGIKRSYDFADKNPPASILEGSEFIKHEQFRLAAKGVSRVPDSEAVQTTEPEDIPLVERDVDEEKSEETNPEIREDAE